MTRGNVQGYVPTTTNGASSKYLIVFTDGKDNSGNEQASKDYANNLKNNGYTIITIFMQSAGMTAEDISHSEEFLKNLASYKPGGGEKYFDSAMYNDTETLACKSLSGDGSSGSTSPTGLFSKGLYRSETGCRRP